MVQDYTADWHTMHTQLCFAYCVPVIVLQINAVVVTARGNWYTQF